MRPRVFPAEDANRQPVPSCLQLRASMRPRVFPAEDPVRPSRPGAQSRRFNEAAGIPRGRRAARDARGDYSGGFNEAAGIPRGRRALCDGEAEQARRASMRPRVFPAEDHSTVRA